MQIYPPPVQANLNVNQPQNVNFLVRRQQYTVGLANNNPDNIPVFSPNTQTPMRLEVIYHIIFSSTRNKKTNH